MKKIHTVLLILIISTSLLRGEEYKRILFISSYNSSFPTFFDQIDGIKSVLDTSKVHLDLEFMDSKRFQDSINTRLFLEHLSFKLKKLDNYDAIITSDDNALEFVIRQHDKLFKNCPVIFCGVNNQELAENLISHPNIIGVAEAVSMQETIDLMVSLFPRSDEIYAIVDNTNTGQSDLRTFYKESSKHSNKKFKEIEVHKTTFSGIGKHLSEISSTTPVLLISAYHDSTNQNLNFENSLQIIRTNLNSPLFHLYNHGLGNGIFGGKTVSHFEQGRAAAMLTHKVLSGVDISQIKEIEESPNVYIFDYNELKRFNIDTNKLPKDSIILNKPETFFSKYKRIIYITISIILMLTGLILFLAFNVLKRKKAEYELALKYKELQTSEEELRATYEEIYRAKEKAEESSKLKTEFLNNISHEINTPMNGILGFSELLANPEVEPETVKFYTQIIRKSTQQLHQIFEDILEISKLGTNQAKVTLATFNFSLMISDLLENFVEKAKEKNLDLVFPKNESDHACFIYSDKYMINKVLMVLVDNAIKYTPKGKVEIAYKIDKDNLTFSVKDTGIGIARANHAIIFKKFSQEEKSMSRKYGGLGLGLSIAKANIELLGGEISLESEKDKGTTFYVNLPVKQVSQSVSEDSKAKEEASVSQLMKILIAEDEELNFLYLEEIFNTNAKYKFEILRARNGKEAVEICETINDISLVLMDVKMPLLNGFEATAQLKKLKPHIPIIIQTAYSSEADKQNAINAGCNDFISKPINKKILFSTIEKLLVEHKG